MEITVLKSIRAELADMLPGARISALDESDGGVLYLTLKTEAGKRTLLVSPRPPMPRVHLTTQKPGKSRELTPFAQSLRNAVIGATVESVTQEGLERALYFHLARKSAMGTERHTLALEFAGKKPELILVDGDGKVALAQSYVPLSDEALRPVLPGLMYQPPPKPDRPEPDALSDDDIRSILSRGAGAPPEKALMKGIGGISPVIAREAVCLAVGAGGTAGGPLAPGRVLACLREVLKAVEDGPYSPRIYQTPKGPVLAALLLEHMSGSPGRGFDTMNEAADAFYDTLIKSQRFSAVKAALLKDARTKLDAARKKAEAIEADLKKAARADEYQLYGNLLMASPGAVADGSDSVELPNLFAEDGGSVTIPLDPQLNTIKNAEACFKKARKARAGVTILRSRLDAAGSEAAHLAARLKGIEEAEDLDELPDAVEPGGRISGRAGAKGKASVTPPAFPSFTSSDGFTVLYGRNANANDVLTFKVADSMDLWLHAQGYHGSHVIVRNPERRPDIPLQTILEAAEVAAQFSEARKDTSVAVDYTFRKYVRKPRDPVPGQAIFTGNKTVFVTPRKH